MYYTVRVDVENELWAMIVNRDTDTNYGGVELENKVEKEKNV